MPSPNITTTPTGTSMPFRAFLKHIMARHWPYVGGLLFIGFLWAIDVSLRPYAIKIVIDRLAGSSAASHSLTSMLLGPAGLYLGLAVLMLVISRWYDYLQLMCLPILRQDSTLFLSDFLFKQDHRYFQNHFAGNLATKINDVARGLRELLIVFVDQFFSRSLALIIAIGTLYTVQPWLALILSVWVIIFLLVSYFAGKIAHKLSEQAASSYSQVTGRLVDILNNMLAVRLFNGKKQERQLLKQWLQHSTNTERAFSWFLFKLWLFQESTFLLVEAFSLVFLIVQYQKHVVTLGDFALVLTLNMHIVDCLLNLSRDFGHVSEHLGRITQGLETITLQPRIVDHPKAKPLRMDRGSIDFDRVVFHYRKTGKPLFQELSASIAPGERVGLVGYSGSGKTTFLNLMLRLHDIQGGSILIDRQNIAEVTQESLHQAISVIPQEPLLFHRSITDNLRYGKPDASLEAVQEAAKKAHAHEFILQLPEGYETLVGERGSKISGGQRQRLAIARAILKDAPILVLDEATSALDTHTEQLIEQALSEFMKTRTALVIAHRLSTLLSMDRILVFDHGAIVESGSHAELLQQEGLYARLWQAQSGGFLPQKKEPSTKIKN